MKEKDYLAEVAAIRNEHWPADAPREPWYPLGVQPMTATGKIVKVKLEKML